MTHIPEILAGVSNSGKWISSSIRNNKKLSLLLLSFLLVATLIATVSAISASRNNRSHPTKSTTHILLRSSCSSTRYPDLCLSSLAAAPALSASLATLKDVIQASLNLTITAVDQAYFKIQKLIQRRTLTSREKTALHDCLEDVDQTLDELHMVQADLRKYPGTKSVSQHADDLKTLLSGAMTNQESCIDGFSHDKADKKVRKELLKSIMHVHRMCSNALAMVRNMTDTDMENARFVTGRKLGEEVDGDGFPSWLSAGDRRLLQASTVTPNVVVAADGSGDFTTVSAAVAAAPEKSSTRYVIRIKAGVYRENVEVPKKKTNLMFVGDGRKTTIITARKNVVDGSTTFNSATVGEHRVSPTVKHLAFIYLPRFQILADIFTAYAAIIGEGFMARDITFENTAGPSKHQAVALRVNADLCAFYQCDMLAYQDTLYVHSLRQFYRSCYIAGTVDFIFGNAAVVLQDCDIHARRPNSGQRNMVTAQGRDDPNQNTGISIHNCRIGATSDLLSVRSSFPTYLGRPWKEYSRTVVMKTVISDVINPAGWHEWNGNFALDTLYYAEYQNTGAGAGTANRVTWKGYKVITSATEAQRFTVGNFIGGSNWLGPTGFPFSLGL